MSRTVATVSLALLIGLPPSAMADVIAVRVVTLGSVAETPVYSAPATAVARNQPGLAAEIEARIVELPVEVGSVVRKGELLARLDCRRTEALLASAQASLDRAQAQAAFAASQLARARDLKRRKSISDELLDQRRTELAGARADTAMREQQLRQAGIDVENCELRAPFDAVVTRRNASVGSYTARGMTVLDLIETQGQEVSAALRHDEAESLQRAERVAFSSNGEDYPLQLRTLLPYIDTATRTREARLTFAGAPAMPGTAGRLTWRGTRSLLPADYLVRRDGKLGVFILDGDTARFHPLPKAEDGRPARIELDPDTRLIGDGRQRLRDGDAVRQSEKAGGAE
jgi:RND family efflux transporter MFP subunit